ncbi:hypothetical protein [Kitasatospora sp. GP82]|uniref:hypothetical protein n=1 Tax=Kitasatospora sp. GP82 TaxID=3035089 RepID=UPI0024755AA0|nr:hypothetical protein [Kitasatospora sp. GP82]MDH6126256.1 hypothetical protein [Kitasatospora sp. GP82]
MNTERTTQRRPAGSTTTDNRRRSPMAQAVRNVGIMLDTAARVVFLGRDGVRLG